MIIRGATLLSRAAAFFTFAIFAIAITACGGGGGGGGGFLGEGAVLKLTLRDVDGNKTNVIAPGTQATLEVKVEGDNNNGVVVAATTTLGTLSPATATTVSGGIARFTLDAGTQRGGGTISASATVNETGVSGTLGFQVGADGLRLGFFDDDGSFVEGQIGITPETTLSASGFAQLSVAILDENGERVTSAEQVTFSSSCLSSGQATLSPANPVAARNGVATAQYTAAGCSGADEITARLGSSVAFGSIDIAPAGANRIVFVSAEPTLIVLKGTGGTGVGDTGDPDLRVETAQVIFQVLDRNGTPMSNIPVTLELSTEVGGLSVSPMSAISDADGRVTATVQAGDIATSVRVIASADDGSGSLVSTVSGLITVSTGLPDQDSFSVGVEPSEEGTFVVRDGFGVNGIERTITVKMADKFNNPVVDGTTAVFTTEYGAIEASCQTGVRNGDKVGGTPASGECSVMWSSQSPRFPLLTGDTFVKTIFDDDYDCPSHNGSEGACPDDLGYTRGGRSTILVHAIGEESFVDRNGNGVMDEAERDLFDNQPEASIDKNEDGVHTPALPECIAAPFGSPRCTAGAEETYIDFNNNNQYDFNDDPAVFNGLLCPPEGDGVWCSRDLINVRDQVVLTLSANPSFDIVVVDPDGNVIPEGDDVEEEETYTAYISDIFNNPPPGGTEITLSTTGECVLLSPNTFTVPDNVYFPGAFTVFPIEVDGEGADDGTLTIDVGGEYSETYTCDTRPPPDPCSFSPPLPECTDPNAP